MYRTLRVILAVLGSAHLTISALFFFAPVWSYQAIAPFAPYNAHLLSDVGAFNLPLGVGLWLAARDPWRYQHLIVLAALGNLMHAASHLRDWHLHVPPSMPLWQGMLTEFGTLGAGLLLLALAIAVRSPRMSAARLSA
ncbi:hypothetical protein HNR42_000216 [Deinobacterium chartae]|uniref:Uncharacterized protein n=1 Tax=Deinobacterium chartae TaxID=521158 RepID=A0A841HVW1_9DEIO|nr:DUF4345 family protein [Deinobacterium chartae]MBB6096804.1 hypothetical protein [Deinobacterium chartae]